MNTATEMKIKVSNFRITKADAMVMADGTCKLTLEVETATQKQNENVNDDFILVKASKLSLRDAFMCRHQPRTDDEKKFKAALTEVIKKGVKDFYRPKMDPSFADAEKTKIHYLAGKRPAVGKSYNWWEKTAKDFRPERNSRLGTKAEYVAFLGVLIKALVAKGWSVSNAWDAVCNNSKELGHYWDSENAKHEFEDTGLREICGFFDLANTYKILAKDEEAGGFWLAGGYYGCHGYFDPLADLVLDNNYNDLHNVGAGWLVLEK